jgi:hypothetical protein
VSRDNLDENGGGNWSLKLLTLIVARQNVTTLLIHFLGGTPA